MNRGASFGPGCEATPSAGQGAVFAESHPSRERLTEAETQVYFLLRKYRVQKHYRASSAAKVTRYAVFVHGAGQITKPAPIVATLARVRTA